MVFDRFADVGGQRAGVADAGGAAVADGLEAEGVEVLSEAGLVVVVGNDAGAGCERGLDPGWRLQALLDGLFGEQAGGDHDVGVGCIGAGGDGGDDDGAVRQVRVGIDAETGLDAGGCGGVRVLSVGCAFAAGHIAVTGGMATLCFPADHLAGGFLVAVGAEQGRQLLLEAGGRLGEQDAVLGAPGAGNGGFYGGEVEGEGGGILGFGRVRRMEEPLLAEIGFDEGDMVFGAAGEAEVLQGLVVDGEDAAGGAVFGGHVGDGGAVGERELGDAGAEELDELANDAVLAKGFGDGEDEVGGGGAFAELAGEAEADDLGDEHGDGLAEHGGLGLDAADAPAEDAEAVDHGGVGVGADQGVGVGEGRAVGLGRGEDDAGEVLEVDLVADAHAGGTAEKLRKAVWPHLRKA